MGSGEVLQIGAGNIGRALVGDIMASAGLHVTFADVAQDLIDHINAEGGYPIEIVSLDGSNTKHVEGVSAISSLDEDAMVEKIVNADFITTAVGAGILPRVAPTLAKGLAARMDQRDGDDLHVVVVACENMERNTETLRDHILEALPDDEMRAKVLANVSFPNAAVDRIVPNTASQNDHPLSVITEDYFQLAIDANGLLTDIPEVGGLDVVADLEATLAQKLFTLNGAHAATAYWGYLKGHPTIDVAMGDDSIRTMVDGLMAEVSQTLVTNYPSITAETQQTFVDKVIRRFLNPYLKDETSRVGREPKRKLSKTDRLVRPALRALEDGATPVNLLAAIVAGFRFNSPEDPQSQEIAEAISTQGIQATVAEVTGLDAGHPLVGAVVAGWEA